MLLVKEFTILTFPLLLQLNISLAVLDMPERGAQTDSPMLFLDMYKLFIFSMHSIT